MVLLYFHAIFIFFRPSEIELKVPRKTRKVQEDIRTTDRAVEQTDSARRLSVRVPIQETGDIKIEPSQSNRNTEEQSAANSLNDVELASTSQSNRNIEETSAANSLNDAELASTSQSNRNIEETSAANSLDDAELANTSQSNRNIEEQSAANSLNDAELASTSQSNRNIEEPSAANSLNEVELASSSQSNRNIEEPSAVNSVNDAEQPNTSQSNRNIEEQSAANSRNDAELASSSQSNRNIEEPSAANSLNDAELASSSQSNRNIEEQSAANSLNETRVDIDQSNEEEDEEETQKPIRNPLAIIVGETYPVGFGSWIGNKLFSTTHERNIAWNIIKFIFMFSTLPLLLFLGLGDLFLVLLPNLHSGLSDHLPFAFLTRSLGYSIIDNHPYLLDPITVISALAYLIRLFCLCFLSRSALEAKWQSCSVHRVHPTWFVCKLLQYFFSELPSSLKPSENCYNPAPPECSKYLDLPENIAHNLEKQPDIFIKCWECCSHFWKRKSNCSSKGFFFSLAVVVSLILIIIIFIIIGIFCTSPLVCLYHGRLRLVSRVFESILMFFSLVWVTILSLLCAIPLGVAIIGLIKVLGSHTNEMLPQVTIAVVALYHFWNCYKAFRTPYRYVAKFLASRYQKKYDEQENGSEVNSLIHYKQGDLKVIPKELFDDGCKEFKLSIKNDVALLLFKLVCTLSAFCFFFPVPGPGSTSAIIAFLAVAYGPIKT
ncbi:uncharacterized protein LOC110067235 [Orbicella faveolata]|uniref:uncharacterized protein LOC110067235 n=1 Tax=Orbicella faveolata TaxID=48498 RepID=UPI0009E21AC6|nr:uncharacterized protein LOC110067235 [Orbicella faveolata]